MTSELSVRLAAVRRRVDAAAIDCGRDPAVISLISVGKTFPAAVVNEAVTAGATDLGENRVQEAVAKRPEVAKARWHLIGPLQRNKARAALEVFDIVHTVDRFEIADRLQYLLTEHWTERILDVLVEINVAEEPQKAGALPEDARGLLEHALGCDRLSVCGLMAIPPWAEDPEASRPWFRKLRELRDRLQYEVGHSLPELSMGMSHDFEIAIAEGATMVRVGTAIFGPRG
ncbi:MAG: YggS family pyridoxal phosphate-dependent enzyme [Acidobacteria bacterium]|uniref:Pyridoxal phosphate homeostasis protein n=1 Tax=Candidatus Sulfomarinibacter kjeldsenii TaxID=2885994 RepID=A0A8J6Y5I5_9BACT|nr:YggS family pyridoxal phosphate-dependent enzyme [Candidatus Sulfomarinibacter kjeldsenii]